MMDMTRVSTGAAALVHPRVSCLSLNTQNCLWSGFYSGKVSRAAKGEERVSPGMLRGCWPRVLCSGNLVKRGQWAVPQSQSLSHRGLDWK